jgi:Flp pilus assembly protein CpaB
VGSRRLIILVAAIVVAAVAGFATVRYLQTVQDRANKGAKLDTVFEIKKPIAKGTTGQKALDDGAIATTRIQHKFRPDTTITDTKGITQLVALYDLPKNQVLVDGLFVKPSVAQVTFAQNVHPGNVAVTVSIGGIQAVGNNLVPGDLVDMMVSINSVPLPGTPALVSPGNATTINTNERLLYQNVKILAIGSQLAPTAGSTTPATPGGGEITFEVPALAAEKIVLAAANSTNGIYLLLVPQTNQATAIAPADAGNLLKGPLVACLDTGPTVQPTADCKAANPGL